MSPSSADGYPVRTHARFSALFRKAIRPVALTAGVAAIALASLRAATLAPFDNFDGQNFSGLDLTGEDGNHSSFDGTDFNSALLSGANLSFSILTKASLKQAVLDGANLEFADLSGAGLGGASLRFANLHGATIDGSQLASALDLTGK